MRIKSTIVVLNALNDVRVFAFGPVCWLDQQIVRWPSYAITYSNYAYLTKALLASNKYANDSASE